MKGRPYTVTELAAAASQPADEYHRHLMEWGAARITELERELDTSKTAERDAARRKRDEGREEISLMLGWLTRRYPVEAHLAAARQGSGWQVVCVHEGEKRLTWRISDIEALAWFTHLKLKDCQSAGTRAEKLAALADLASR